MNLDKARDYFSAYYEGSLDRGLKQTFEARLREDSELQDEYRSFEYTMRELDSYATPINIPSDLHERISARLDKHVWDEKQKKAPALVTWWKSILVGGVAVAVVALGTFAVKSGGRASVAGSGLPLASGASLKLSVIKDNAVGVDYPAQQDTIVIRDSKGAVLTRVDLGGQEMKAKPVENPNADAQLVSIEVVKHKEIRYLALPGSVRNKQAAGKGTLKDFVVALAGFYDVPVVLQSKDQLDTDMSWKFESSDASSAADKELRSLKNMQVEQKDSMISISQN